MKKGNEKRENRFGLTARDIRVRKRRKYKKLKKIIINVGIVCLLVVIGVASYNIYSKKNNEKKAKEQYVEIEQKVTQEPIEETLNTKPQEEEKYEEVELLKELVKQNDEVVGFITIADTNIKYPIVQAKDNDYYLSKTYEKKDSASGSIFLDCKNNNDFNDINSILYGHNMKDGSMFANLLKYRDSNFLKKQPYINIFLKDRVLKYEIFSVYVTEADYDYRTKKFESDDDINSFLNRITCKNEHTTAVQPKVTDKILTLSTCAFDFDDARLAVHAVLIDEKKLDQ